MNTLGPPGRSETGTNLQRNSAKPIITWESSRPTVYCDQYNKVRFQNRLVIAILKLNFISALQLLFGCIRGIKII